MGKGLSPLQTDIMTALDQWTSYEQAASAGRLDDWALPRDIIDRLGLPKNVGTSASVSRALARLHERGLIARARSRVASVGKSFRYLRITDPANAGASPLLDAEPKPKRLTVEDRVAQRIWEALIDAKVIPADTPLPPKRQPGPE